MQTERRSLGRHSVWLIRSQITVPQSPREPSTFFFCMDHRGDCTYICKRAKQWFHVARASLWHPLLGELLLSHISFVSRSWAMQLRMFSVGQADVSRIKFEFQKIYTYMIIYGHGNNIKKIFNSINKIFLLSQFWNWYRYLQAQHRDVPLNSSVRSFNFNNLC